MPIHPEQESSRWQTRLCGGLTVHCADNLVKFSELFHGFTTRQGGVSVGNYSSLNLGDHVGDSIQAVTQNRALVAEAAGFERGEMVFAQQVHGVDVGLVTSAHEPVRDVDALITDNSGLLLTLMFADCVPIFFYDPDHRVIGLAHSGWKGTVKNVASSTLREMHKWYGTNAVRCEVAIGPCIGQDRYVVGPEVAASIEKVLQTGPLFSAVTVLTYNNRDGKYLLNLREAVRRQLDFAGVPPENIVISDQCTFTNKKEFYSHRRDARGGGQTGRMAAVMGLRRGLRFEEEQRA
jgi:polyphenol oxidase